MEPRKRKRLLMATALVVVLGIGSLLMFSTDNPEPTFEDRQLSEWVKIRANFYGTNWSQPERDRATTAIRFIGTNALPHLVSWIGYEPTGWRRWVLLQMERHPQWTRGNRTVQSFLVEPAERAQGAAEGFAALGPAAAPAIPALSQIVHSTNYSTRTRQHALAALGHIGPDAVPVVMSVVSNLHQPSDLWMISPLLRMGMNARPIVPVLLSQTQNTNLNVAVTILQVLRVVPADPDTAVPVLTRCLEDPRREVRLGASAVLSQIGWPAHDALPALFKALYDTNTEVRASVTSAINSIDPKAMSRHLRE